MEGREMERMDMLDRIRRILDNLPDRFGPNELAYLTLTGKSELQIRDALAYKLHEDIGSSHLVAREYYLKMGEDGKRYDLAILPRGEVKNSDSLFLEIKLHYSANFAAGVPSRLAGVIDGDIEKILGVGGAFLHLIGTPGKSVAEKLRSIVKYPDLIDRGLSMYESSAALEEAGLEKLGQYLREKYADMQVASGKFSAGTAFGIPVKYSYLIVY